LPIGLRGARRCYCVCCPTDIQSRRVVAPSGRLIRKPRPWLKQMQGPAPQPGSLKRSYVKKVIFAVALIVIASVGVRVFLWPRGNDKPSVWLFSNTPHLVYAKVMSGPVTLSTLENRYWTVTVNPLEMRSAHVVGTFEASGGPESDIQVVLAEASEFEKWKNGREARTLYFGDQITSGKFDVRLPEARTYILSFRNTSSTINKQASAEIFLRYLATPIK
ncbi:MAG: hypothetical protein ACM3NO_05230, partial [Deltaproteobacteria bacterium]